MAQYWQSFPRLFINKQGLLTLEDKLTINTLMNYGFKVVDIPSKHRIHLSRNGFSIVIIRLKSIFHTRADFYYPLTNLTELKEVYEKVQRQKLTLYLRDRKSE